jgi:hypothetical protein
MNAPLATHTYSPGGVQAALAFLKRTHSELRTLRCVRIWKDRLDILDVNQDVFQVRGIGYRDAEIIPLLHYINTVFNPETIHNETDVEYKEFSTGKCHPWAHDRVM